ncbi:hypothetical protein J1N35_044969 [Gossypium stocksii]|uniref:Uncharacterized protein n=1 Tax=Gossypium stocksii TaxID=47602 RepID=A0A9D3ZGH5_9ROSI|nr:hypothetical protein J1N35_044969 [Gossypium stocksii]
MENKFLDKVDDNAAVRIWSEKMQLEKGDRLAEGCFTFGNVDLVPTVDEYTVLLRYPRVQVDKAYSGAVNVSTFVKKLLNVTGMDMKKRIDVFVLSIYGLMVFPKALGHIDKAVSDLFDRLDKSVTSVPIILAETFRSLNAWRMAGEGRFIGLQIKTFIPATQGLAQCEFSYKGDNYKKKVQEMSNVGNQTRRMKRFAVGPMTTHKHNGWWSRRINDNISRPSQEGTRPMEEYLQVSLNKIEELKRKIEELETALQNYELRVELLEAIEERWKEQLHHS